MNGAQYPYAGQQAPAATVSMEEYRRLEADCDQWKSRAEEANAKVSAIALILQDPSLTWKQKCLRSSISLALEAQRPSDDPTAPFLVDTGQLARRAGLIPPTPEGDEKALQSAWKSGRKLAGEALKELADAGAFDDYRHIEDRDHKDRVIGERIALQIRQPHIEVIRSAARLGGERTLQQPRGRNVPAPKCPVCGKDRMHLKCTDCAWTGTGQEWAAMTAAKGAGHDAATDAPPVSSLWKPDDHEEADDGGTGFQRLETGLETLCTENTGGGGGDTGFQSLETGESEQVEAEAAVGPADQPEDREGSGGDSPPTCVDSPVSIEGGQKEPEWLEPIPANFPQELVNLRRHWMWSKPEPRGDGTYKKRPYSPHNGFPADKTDFRDRGTVYEALDAMKRYDGRFVGPGLDGNEGLVFADLDHCVDPVTGEVEKWARSVVDVVPSMRWEFSPSGTGLHGCGRGVKPVGSGCRWKIGEHEIEVYSSGAFVTVTGHLLPGTSARLGDCTEELGALHRRLYPPQPSPARNGHAPVFSSAGDLEVCERVRRKHGSSFLQELLTMPDDSGREFTAARWCADYTQDSAQIERILGSWGLREARPDPEKWDRPDYLQRTISRAIESAKLRRGGNGHG